MSSKTRGVVTIDRHHLFFGDESLIQRITPEGEWRVCHDVIEKSELTPYTVGAHHGLTVKELSEEFKKMLKIMELGQRGKSITTSTATTRVSCATRSARGCCHAMSSSASSCPWKRPWC